MEPSLYYAKQSSCQLVLFQRAVHLALVANADSAQPSLLISAKVQTPMPDLNSTMPDLYSVLCSAILLQFECHGI
ncbi:hypothetical protein ACB092_M013300 [Castanea dentata]